MAKKSEELNNPNSCFNKVAPDEPIFILRAQDAYAPELVRYWAELAHFGNVNPAKVTEARDIADLMEAWPNVRMPD